MRLDSKSVVPEDIRNDFTGCPFCGRLPQLNCRATSKGETEEGDGRMIFFAACYGGGYFAHAHQFAYSLSELLEKWNTRV